MGVGAFQASAARYPQTQQVPNFLMYYVVYVLNNPVGM